MNDISDQKAPESLSKWGERRSPSIFDPNTAHREGSQLAKRETLDDEEMRQVAARILEPGAQWVYPSAAIASDMSGAMRRHLGLALINPAYPLSW